jgi:hypothetical protein
MTWLIILSPWILWIFYLAVMSLFRANENKTLSLPAKILGYPVLIIGVLLDAMLNIFLLSLILFERPYEWLITKRLARHIKNGTGWRFKLALWICQHLLNPFDPDQRGHCR